MPKREIFHRASSPGHPASYGLASTTVEFDDPFEPYDGPKRAAITGITGQDGSLLARHLLRNGYIVYGLMRRSSSFNTWRIDDLRRDESDEDNRFFLHYGDMTDGTSLRAFLSTAAPHEIYNLAAQSHVGVSFEVPEYTGEVDALGTLRLLEAYRQTVPTARFYQAGTSEMFGLTPPPQTETSPHKPLSPYAAAKVYAHNLAGMYREAYGLWIARGILFNHESEYRGENFVTRKIAIACAKAMRGDKVTLRLGNLDARRDWGWAEDYVRGMHAMLQHHEPDDFVLATGRSHTVFEFLRECCKSAGLEMIWRGDKSREVGFNVAGNFRVIVDERLIRPLDVPHLMGDANKARVFLGWEPSRGLQGIAAQLVHYERMRLGVT